MVTVEQFNLVFQAVTSVANLRNDMVKNAVEYKRLLAQGVPESVVQELAAENAAEYRKRLARINTDDVDLKAGLAHFQVTDFNSEVEVVTASEAKFTVSKAQLLEKADEVLTDVEKPKRIF